jgi:hypothetical protein
LTESDHSQVVSRVVEIVQIVQFRKERNRQIADDEIIVGDFCYEHRRRESMSFT